MCFLNGAFWELGPAVSPILFTRMVLLSGWRLGYIVIGAFQTFLIAILLISILKNGWKQETDAADCDDLTAISFDDNYTNTIAKYIQKPN